MNPIIREVDTPRSATYEQLLSECKTNGDKVLSEVDEKISSAATIAFFNDLKSKIHSFYNNIIKQNTIITITDKSKSLIECLNFFKFTGTANLSRSRDDIVQWIQSFEFIQHSQMHGNEYVKILVEILSRGNALNLDISKRAPDEEIGKFVSDVDSRLSKFYEEVDINNFVVMIIVDSEPIKMMLNYIAKTSSKYKTQCQKCVSDIQLFESCQNKLTSNKYPPNEKTYDELGIELFNLQQFSMAIQYFTKSIKLNNCNPKTLYLLGLCHYQLGDYLTATTLVNRATELDLNKEVDKQKSAEYGKQLSDFKAKGDLVQFQKDKQTSSSTTKDTTFDKTFFNELTNTIKSIHSDIYDNRTMFDIIPALESLITCLELIKTTIFNLPKNQQVEGLVWIPGELINEIKEIISRLQVIQKGRLHGKEYMTILDRLITRGTALKLDDLELLIDEEEIASIIRIVDLELNTFYDKVNKNQSPVKIVYGNKLLCKIMDKSELLKKCLELIANRFKIYDIQCKDLQYKIELFKFYQIRFESKKRPPDDRDYNEEGINYLNDKNIPMALLYFNNALKLNRYNNPTTHFNLGLAYFASGSYLKARDCFDKTTQIDMNNAKAYRKRGESHIKLAEEKEKEAQDLLVESMKVVEAGQKKSLLEDCEKLMKKAKDLKNAGIFDFNKAEELR